MTNNSKVELFFSRVLPTKLFWEEEFKIKTLVTDNYVILGQITALRFLEWVFENPLGVIALPTGKTPEFFIKWVQYYLNNWDKEAKNGIIKEIGLPVHKPDMHGLTFFQIDEFFPMNPLHERSFNFFVNEYYIKRFGLNPQKVHLLDTYHLPDTLVKKYGFSNTYEIFENDPVDLSLRWRHPMSLKEEIRKQVLTYYDNYCQFYEEKIRGVGGIGFFLGGIGPDGHIAFNIRGSSHFSTTRLDVMNYETQAASATDLGGIELLKKKAVVTIGLSTIQYRKDVVAIIIVAGQSKSKVVADALQKEPSVEYPATSLQKLPNARFYITLSSTKHLKFNINTIKKFYEANIFYPDFGKQLLINTFYNSSKTLKEIELEIVNTQFVEEYDKIKILESLFKKPILEIITNLYQHINNAILRGISIPKDQRILHTAPHHDDIELAYFPLLHHLVRSASNENYFCYCTSGYTAVTNQYLVDTLKGMLSFFENGVYQKSKEWMNDLTFDSIHEDVTGYLNGLASQSKEIQLKFLYYRLSRHLILKYRLKLKEQLIDLIKTLIVQLERIEPGRKEPDTFYELKSWIREFEAELVWAHFGISPNHVFHLRLPFYSDEIFPQYPVFEKDVKPLLLLMEKIKPTLITLALDPEGSGPDTHFKTLIALSEAIDIYAQNNPSLTIKVWGYRNIWSQFEIYESNLIFPTSLNSFAVLHNMFNSCFLSQKTASFPSYEYDGTFSELAQKIWVEQFQVLKKFLGDKYFYESTHPMLRRAFGAIFIKEMDYELFKEEMKPIKRLFQLKEKKML